MNVRKSLSVAFLTITQTFFLKFYKMAAVGHFGCSKFTLDHISGYIRPIQIFCHFFLIFFTKWLPVAILDVRKSLSISFLAISDRYTTLFCFEIAILDVRKSLLISFLSISHLYATLFIFLNFDKMADVGHFGCPNFTFDRFSIHFTSIRNFNFFEIFDKMADVGHFGCPQITFDRISGHFRSTTLFFFDKIAAGGHFG